MKPTTLIFLALLSLAACKNPKVDVSVDDHTADTTMVDTMADNKDTPPPVVDSATMMNAWIAYATPGDMHKWMAKSTGTWTVDVTGWMDPDKPPFKSTATATSKMDLNGLYQITDFKGTMMDMPFLGHGILAYDNAKKHFVTTWIDNMGSGILIMTGTLDTTNNMLSLKGSQTDPVTGKDSPFREEVKFIDDNTHMTTLYGLGMDGKEMKLMEMTMKRKV